MTASPSTFGSDLFTRAHAHGVTSQEVATLLALPVATIRRLTSSSDLDQHTTAALRALAERLDLLWPPWLATAPTWPPPAPPATRSDPARVHALLAAAFGHGLHLSEIAHILQWTIDRVHAAVTQLATRVSPGGGTRLHYDGSTAVLEVAPGTLDDPARHRLRHVLQVYGLEPDVKVLHLVYKVIGMYGDGPPWIHDEPDLIDDAIDHGLLIWDTDHADGSSTLRLHPDVRYSLGITQYRYPPEDPAGPTADST